MVDDVDKANHILVGSKWTTAGITSSALANNASAAVCECSRITNIMWTIVQGKKKAKTNPGCGNIMVLGAFLQ